MEEIVPNYETCLKLKEHGFTQATCLGWHPVDDVDHEVLSKEMTIHWDAEPECAAPTFQEISDHFPSFHSLSVIPSAMIYARKILGNQWVISAKHFIGATEENIPIHETSHKNAAQAAAQMWIWLKENRYIQ